MPIRRLAAIMFTDIAGYTAMMQADETNALQIRNRHRAVFEESHEEFQGTILQYYGDGTLSIFDSAIDAVQCAIKMQVAFQQAPQVPLRIGIHTGDILYSKEEAVGNGVNVASRVESLAAPGSIFLSESVYQYIQNQVDIPVNSMGTFFFKNVEKPMEVFAVAREDLHVPLPKSLTGKFIKHIRPGQQSLWQRMPMWSKYVGGFLLFLLLAPIIYSPFVQLPLGTAADGDMIQVTDEDGHMMERMLIKAEDKTRFYVTSFENTTQDSSLNWATKAIPYALEMDWDQDPYILNIYSEFERPKSHNEEIEKAKSLDCEHVLKGSVSKEEGMYSINIRLYSVDNGQMEFEEAFTGEELLVLLDDVSMGVKRILGFPESHLEKVKDLPVRHFLTDSEEALEQFGTALYERTNGRFFPFDKLQGALEIDSTFAWAANYTSSMLHRFQRSKQQALAMSSQAMRHRKRLPEFFEAELRQLYYEIHDEPEKALKLSEMLLTIHPDNINYHISYIQQLARGNQYEACLKAIESARQLSDDPFYLMDLEVVSLNWIGKRQEAISLLEKFLKQHPEEPSRLARLGCLYMQEKEWEKAESAFDKAMLLDPDTKVYSRLLESMEFQRDSAQHIPLEMLQTYAGIYWIEEYTGFEMLIEEHNGLLYARATNQNRFELYPLSSNTFTAAFSMVVKFERDQQGHVDRLLNSEGESAFYSAIKIDPQMLKGIDYFKSEQWEAAKETLTPLVKAYPQHEFLQLMLQHIDFRAHPSFAQRKADYQDLAGFYKEGKQTAEIQLNEQGEIVYHIDRRAALDPMIWYETEPDVFMQLVSLTRRFRIVRKNGVPVSIEDLQEGTFSHRIDKPE